MLSLRKHPERFLATVQVGITVVGATAAAFGGASIAARIAPLLREVRWIGERADAVALSLVIAAVSYLSIVIGELVPKSLALRSAERYALLVSRPLLALSWVARPVVWLLSLSANLVLKPFGDRTTFTETRHSAEELQHLVEEAARAGTIHPDAGEMASRALDLPDLTVADVMVPRQEVVMIPRHASNDEIRRILLEHTHSRMPVYEERVDNIVGYVSIRDLLALAWEHKLFVLEDVMRPPQFVPESKHAVELLREMRDRHQAFAIVVDEYGGMSGIVTIEDLIEEVVGDIFSEHVPTNVQLVHKLPDGSAIVAGAAPVREVNRLMNTELPDEGAWSTIAGLCLELSGRVPTPGEVLHTPKGFALEIIDASPRRIRTVRVHPPPPSERSDDDE